MAGARKAASDYLEQTKSYDMGNPGTSVPDEKRKKKGFQPAENVGMPMPSPVQGRQIKTEDSKGLPKTRPTSSIQNSSYRADAFRLQRETNDPKAIVAGIKEEQALSANPTRGKSKEEAELIRAELASTFRPSSLAPRVDSTMGGSSSQPDVAGLSKAFDTASRKNISRFDPSKTTLGNNEFTGQVGLFKDGQMMDPSQTRLSGGNLGGTPLPSGQQTSFMRMPTPEGGFGNNINYTDLFNQDAKIGQMQLDNAKNDYRIGEGNPKFFTGPGEPGPGSYGADSMATKLASRRDELIKQLDDVRARSGMSSNPSFDDRLNFQIQTKALQSEIANIDQQIFGRTELANKIQQALIGRQTTLDQQGLANKGGLDKQLAENAGTMGVRTMMEGHEDARHAATLGTGMETAANTEQAKRIAEARKVLNERNGKFASKYFDHLVENGLVNNDNIDKIASALSKIGINEDDDAASMKIFGTK